MLMQYKSGSLYFLHKLLNETTCLRSMKSPGVGITVFFVCPTVGKNHSEADPVLFVTQEKITDSHFWIF